MTKVNHRNWEVFYDSETDGITMIDSGRDENDNINLKKLNFPAGIVGGTGDDKIYGSTKHMNFIAGDAPWGLDDDDRPTEENYRSFIGNDTVYGGNNSDLIHGGLGDDRLYGKGGVNIFQFKKGDGDDTIYMGRGKDYLYFCDSSFSELSYTQKNNDLIISYGNNDKVTVKNYYKTFGYVSLKGIADRTFNFEDIDFDFEDLLDDDIRTERDLLRLENRFSKALENLMKRTESVESLTSDGMTIIKTKGGRINGTNGDDIIRGSKRKDTIEAGKGNDVINAGKGNDIIRAQSGKNKITAGAGNDRIYSGSGADTFVFSKGAGKDTIYDSTNKDKIRYTDVNSVEELTFDIKKNDLLITRKNGIKKETITLDEYFRKSKKLDKIVLANGKRASILKDATLKISGSGTINGSDYNETIKGSRRADRIYAKGGNDNITAGKGDDIINAGTGTNNIYFAKRHGDDVILNGGGVDTLVFNKMEQGDVKAKYLGKNLVLYYTGGSVTLKDFKKGNHSAKYVQFGSVKKSVEDLVPYNVIKSTSENIVGTELKDKITTTMDTLTINAKGGNDLITVNTEGVDIKPGKGNDSVILNYGEAKIHLYSNDGVDTITKDGDFATGNTLIFENESNVSGLKYTATSTGYNISYNNGADTVKVVNKNMVLNESNPDEDVWGLGNENVWDTVKLNSGNKYLTTNKGLLRDFKGNSSSTTLNASDEADYIATNAVTIKAKGGNDYIALMTSDTRNIYGGKGNDNILIYASGNRNFFFANGDGNDVVYDDYATSGARTDKIVYNLSDAIDFSQISVKQSGYDVKISYNNNKDSILIKNTSGISYDDLSEVNFGYIKIGNTEKEISSFFTPTPDPNESKPMMFTSYVEQIKEEVVGFESTGMSDVSNIFEDKQQDVAVLLNSYVDDKSLLLQA